MQFSFRAALRAGILCSLFAANTAPQLQAEVIAPIGLAPGAQYQLVFVTAGTIVPTSGTEAPYNAFVNAEAALSPSLPSTTWSSITSTSDGTNANVNAPWLGLPVYNTQGQLVASPATGFYVTDLIAPILGDQYGESLSTTVWSGSDYYGNNFGFGTLGSPYGFFGQSNANDYGWLAYFYNPGTSAKSLYALSGAITLSPVPEPASVSLLGVGLAMLGGMQLRRRSL